MSSEIDFSLFIAALRRRWWIVLLCLVIALAIGVGIGLAQARPYEAANILLVQSPRYQWRLAGEISAITDQRRDFQREVLAIARSNEIAQAAAEALEAAGLEPAITAQALTSAVTVRAGDGNTIVVTANSDDPERAAAYAASLDGSSDRLRTRCLWHGKGSRRLPGRAPAVGGTTPNAGGRAG